MAVKSEIKEFFNRLTIFSLEFTGGTAGLTASFFAGKEFGLAVGLPLAGVSLLAVFRSASWAEELLHQWMGESSQI